MHGVSISSRNEEDAQSQKEKIERITKFQKYRSLCTVAIKSRREHHHDPNALELASKLLSVNPDFYSLWNFRREIILTKFPASIEGSELVDQAQATIQAELRLTKDALGKNPKSYSSWWHRRWVIDTFLNKFHSNRELLDLDGELELCTKLLQLDERNFHCWGYRNHICNLVNKDLLSELDFTQQLIERNFSNYSAWNHRTLVLSKLMFRARNLGGTQKEVVKSELDLVHNAVFTEPADQSAWMYMRWLISCICHQGSDGTTESGKLVVNLEELTLEVRIALLSEEYQTINELLEMEEHSKWALLTLVRLMEALDSLSAQIEEDSRVLVKHCEKLMEVDPVHKQYYSHLLETMLMNRK